MKQSTNAKKNAVAPLGSVFVSAADPLRFPNAGNRNGFLMNRAAPQSAPKTPASRGGNAAPAKAAAPTAASKSTPAAKSAPQTWVRTNAFGGWPNDEPAKKTMNAKNNNTMTEADLAFGNDFKAAAELAKILAAKEASNTTSKSNTTAGKTDKDLVDAVSGAQPHAEKLHGQQKQFSGQKTATGSYANIKALGAGDYDNDKDPLLTYVFKPLAAKNEKAKAQNTQAADGSTSTVDPKSFSINGKKVLLPQAWYDKNGKEYHSKSDTETLKHYQTTVEPLGAEGAGKKDRYIYDPMNWEKEFQNNIKSRIDQLSPNLSNQSRVQSVDAIILEEAEKLQQKYETDFNASNNFLASIGSPGLHDALNPLFTEYPTRETKKNRLLEAAAKGFSAGFSTGMWSEASKGISPKGTADAIPEGAGDAADISGFQDAYEGSPKSGNTALNKAADATEGAGDVGKIPWDSWQNYEKVTANGQEYAKVGNRLYSKHAVDRMQPSGKRFTVGDAIVQAGGVSGRSVAPQFVEDVIKSVEPVFQPATGNYVYTSGTVRIVTNEYGYVVTIMTVGR